MFQIFGAFKRLTAAVERLAGLFEDAARQIESRQSDEPPPVLIDAPAPANGRKVKAKEVSP